MIEALLELDRLKNSKNLLAFSAGVDSSALFFLLQSLNIKIDLALINYQTRATSNDEEEFAKELGREFGVRVFTTKAPKFQSDFENRAREFRYNFFEEIIDEQNYQNLLTAHHLGDRLEWFFMKLIRGAGVVELLGMEPKEVRFTKSGKSYNLIRPLLNLTKDELLEFLRGGNYRYFIDESNFDSKFERNFIREKFANPLLRNYQDGIKRSFEYLTKDRNYLSSCFELKTQIKDLAVFELKDKECLDRAVNSYLKRFNLKLSKREREILKIQDSLIVARRWAVGLRDKKTLFIAPFFQTNLPKKFKEECRVAKIPPKIRPYLYTQNISPREL